LLGTTGQASSVQGIEGSLHGPRPHSGGNTDQASSHLPLPPRQGLFLRSSPKIDRMKTRKVDSMFLKLDVACDTVRMFGRPEEPGGAVGSERLLHPG